MFKYPLEKYEDIKIRALVHWNALRANKHYWTPEISVSKPYKKGYQMYDYITKDLVELLKDDFGVSNLAISGHSMGGHGALVIGLRNPGVFKSISAFSPITNPINSAWGKKALAGYLGDDSEAWKEYDACELLKQGHKSSNPIMVDQGLGDEFYPDQLLTETFENVCKDNGQDLRLGMRERYDHSYYFIASFIEDHIKFHKQYF